MNPQEILQALYAGKISLEDAKKALTVEAKSGSTQGTVPTERVRVEEPVKRASPAQETGRKEAIAIVGMSGKYPDAHNLSEYWDNLVQGKNAVREIPLARFNVSDYYDPNPAHNGKIYCKWLGALDEIEYFDPLFFRLSPVEAEGMDPQHRLFLEEGYKAFEDAGYSPRLLSNRKCGSYLGIMSHEYDLLLSQQKAAEINVVGISSAIAAARLAYLLNLKGPAIAIDTACSSSLVATHLACQALWNQEIDMALVGGVSLYLTPDSYIGMCSAGMLSPDGQCKTFDTSANGFVPGEGVGALVLKRLADAEADHDQIYGVIIASGMNQDGATNGITAPSVKSQIELEREIYQRYQIDPESISYVEMHGTGTKLGDPIELEALATVFQEKTQRKQFCAIGSVKSNIGHTSAAAGVASLQKVLLAMKQRKLVPSLHFQQPNEHFDFEASPFYVNTEVQDWKPATEGTPLRAAVSSFGFSGTNAHLVVEEYIPERAETRSRGDADGAVGAGLALARSPYGPHPKTPCLFVLSAKSEQQLKSYAQEMRHWIQAHADLALTDIAFTLQLGRDAMDYRLAIVADSHEVLLHRLERFLADNQASVGVYVGYVKKGTHDAALFDGDADAQSLLHIWCQKKDLAKIAQVWVRGVNVDWKLLYTVGAGSAQGTGEEPTLSVPTPPVLPYRISLPTYPFARERYWISTKDTRHAGYDLKEETQTVLLTPSWKEDAILDVGVVPCADPVPTAPTRVGTGLAPVRVEGTLQPETITPVSPSGGQEALRERANTYFKKHLATVTKLPMQQIDPEAPLLDYGFDSIMAVRFTNALEDSFGPLSKTLLFEYPTLHSVTEYFLHSYPDQLRSALRSEGINIMYDPNQATPQGTQERRAFKGRYSEGACRERGSGVEWRGESETAPNRPSPPPGSQDIPQDDIAIIGISGRYPQARNLKDYWKNLKAGRDCITEIPQERWPLEGFYHADFREAVEQGRSYSKWGGFVEGFADFDPLFFHMSPREALNLDPQERLFIETCWEALEDAGYTREQLAIQCNRKVGVFAGITKTGFELYGPDLWRQDKSEDTLPPLRPHTSFSSVANRISYLLNLQGPSMPIDTMCSSSLTAIHEACEHIHRGECEMALAGGVNLYLHPSNYIDLCMLKMLSVDGQCKSFGQGGNGFVPGEGVGVVLLKRLSRAIADHDQIYAVIRATGINHDGATNGYTVPNPTAQAELIRTTLDKAGISARTVSYIEAHGTGTELGDPIEVTGLTHAFYKDTQDTGFCALGSVKSNIGHLEAAAGIAGVTKIVLQMKHQQIVPSLHAETLNPYINFARTPFVVQQELADWKPPLVEKDDEKREYTRIAGISSFGAAGANAHVVLEEYVPDTHQRSVINIDAHNPAIIVLSARSEEQLKKQAQQLLEEIIDRQFSDENLADIAYTLQVGREAMEERLALMAESIKQLAEKLEQFLEGQDGITDLYRGQVKRHKESLAVIAVDEDIEIAIDTWVTKRKYHKLLNLWVKGLAFDWNKLYEDIKPYRISLPTYPFAHERYWIPTPTSRGSGRIGLDRAGLGLPSSATYAALHPLVQRNTSTLWEQRFNSTFYGHEFFLADHVIKEQRIMPGVAYLEMARAAVAVACGLAPQVGAHASYENHHLDLSHIVWVRPLIVGELPVTVHIALEPQDNTTLTFLISHADEQEYRNRAGLLSKSLSTEEEYITQIYCQGRAVLSAENTVPNVDLTSVQARCQRQVSAASCYQRYREMSMRYGPALQGIEQLRVGEDEVLARLRLPACIAQTHTDFVLHPTLLDAALQACIGLLLERSEVQIPYLPFELESLSIVDMLPAQGWAWVRRRTIGTRTDTVGTGPTPVRVPTDTVGTGPTPVRVPTDTVGTGLAPVRVPTDTVGTGPTPVRVPTDTVGTGPAPVRVPTSVADTVGTGLAPVRVPTSVFDIEVCDDAGRVALSLHGLTTRPLSTRSEEIRTLLLTPVWKEADSAGQGQALPRRQLEEVLPPVQQLVLLCDLPGIEVSRIQAGLSESGRCRSMTVGKQTEAVGERTGTSPVPTVHFQQSRRERHFQDVVQQLIQELQRLLQSRPAGSVLMQVVVAHREEPSFLEALASVLKTAQQEYPQLQGQLIEVEGEPEDVQLLTWLREDQLRMPQEPHVRYATNGYLRDGKRWVMQWQEVGADGSRPHPYGMPWKEGGCYLITGGSGGLAKLFMQEIARHVQEATIILVGRSALSVEQRVQLNTVDGVPNADLVRGSSGGIRVDYQQVDVTDGSAVYSLIQRVLQQHGHLDGIIHAAGVLSDSLLLNKTPAEVEAVLAPKVIGVGHLDEASRQIPLDFFVLCSSLAAVAGNVGQSDYAAANGYLDAFARMRQALVTAGKRQGTTVSINWPLWEEGGMQVGVEQIKMMRERLGVEMMETETGMRVLYQALASGFAQVAVVYGQVERIKQRLSGRIGPMVGAVPAGSVTDLDREDKDLRTADSRPTPDPKDVPQPSGAVPIDKLRETLMHMVSRILKVRVEEIDSETDLSEYGFDSITFTQFANRLNQTYQLDLTPTLFFEHSTIESLTRYLQKTSATALVPHFAENLPIADEHAPVVPKLVSDVRLGEELPAGPISKRHSRLAHSFMLASASPSPARTEPIAIIGMSGRFPQSPDLPSYWRNLLAGCDCIGEIPQERWDWQTYFGNPATEPNKTNIKWAGVIEGIDLFDPLFFGISPREAEQMDPQQRLLMMYAWKAIEDAGYAAESLSGTNTALFVGTGNSGYSERVFRANMAIEGYSATGLAASVGPNRISYFLNLHGPSESIDTACSSSLVAIHRGVHAIESGQCSLAIVGGVNTLISPEAHISFNKAGMLSSDGRCKTFGIPANGYVRGEGIGILVLKKLSEAEQAGDHIYAVIRGSAENHGGRAASLTAPNPRAQADVLIAAYRKAGIDPRSVGYIEAHGTGTELGDPVEINGLKMAFSELAQTIGEGPVPPHACGIGSVKSNIGHLELASGVAGVIKVLLQLQHKKLVKSLHCEQINPYIQLEESPFYIVQENRDWEALRDRTGKVLPRRAGISSFGFGGVNAHVVLEEYVPKPMVTQSGIKAAPGALIVLSAKNEERLYEQVQQLLAWIHAETCANDTDRRDKGSAPCPYPSLQDLAYTLQVGRTAMEERLALQVPSLQELEDKLRKYLQEPQEASDWYRGQVRRHKETIALLNADEELRETINKWFQSGQYEKLLQWWVKGLKIDWQHIYTVGALPVKGSGSVQDTIPTALPCRISLPTYPFAKESYWIPTPHTDGESGTQLTIPAISLPIIPANPPHLSSQRSHSDIAKPDQILAFTTSYLVSILSTVLKISPEKLDLQVGFDEYGLGSIVIQQLHKMIEEVFGPIPSTTFFQYKCIEDLAQYFLREHKKTIHALFLGSVDCPYPSSDQPQNLVEVAVGRGLPLSGSRPSQITGRQEPTTVEQDIAIIGISGQYPQSTNLDAFWSNLECGRDCIVEIPKERWDYQRYYQPKNGTAGKTGGMYCKWGGFLPDIDKFDASFFHISPLEARFMDPQERLFLQTVSACFEDAGYSKQLLKDESAGDGRANVGVFAGVTYNNYQLHLLQEYEKGNFVPINSQTYSIANRVSYIYNLRGPSLSIDTACSSSLAAIHLACESIKRGECAMAIAGGVNLSLHPSKYISLCAGQFASSDGHCRSFGQDGDGYVPGEGVGAVLLKPLRDAIADGDHIYALIKGTAINNDGKTFGYSVPNPVAQTEVIRKALEAAHVDPRTISYVEAHGTGTKLGDPIEITGLSDAFKEYTSAKQYCAIGSVKSNIGHLEAAAGIAQVTKVILQMKHKKLVPSLLHTTRLNPHIDFENTPFFVQQTLGEWKQPVVQVNGEEVVYPRRAGISSFGAGGVNVHIVLEEYQAEDDKYIQFQYPQAGRERTGSARGTTPTVSLEEKYTHQTLIGQVKMHQSARDQEPVIIVLSAKKEDNLRDYTQRLKDYMEQTMKGPGKMARLKDLAYTLQTGRDPMPCRLAFIARDPDEILKKLEIFLNHVAVPSSGSRKDMDSRRLPTGKVYTPNPNESSGNALGKNGLYIGYRTAEKGSRMEEPLDDLGTVRSSPIMMEKIADLWASGREIDWESMYQNERCLRVPLPTYPFSKERYWIEDAPFELGDHKGQYRSINVGTKALPPVRPQVAHTDPMGRSVPSMRSRTGGRAFVPTKTQPTESQEEEDEKPGQPEISPFLAELCQALEGERQGMIEKYVQDLLASLLAFNPPDVPELHQGFFDMGMESVIAEQFRASLEESFLVDIVDTAVFDYPNISELSEYIVKHMPFSEIEKLDKPPLATVEVEAGAVGTRTGGSAFVPTAPVHDLASAKQFLNGLDILATDDAQKVQAMSLKDVVDELSTLLNELE
jgi:acyl transferase domain-containing protein/acyl carrier protein